MVQTTYAPPVLNNRPATCTLFSLDIRKKIFRIFEKAYCHLRKSVRFRKKNRISRNWLGEGPKFCKLQEAIWLTVINEIFKFPPHFEPSFQVIYLYELSSGYPKYPTQKGYIWASFQTSRKRFHKLQEAIWPTVIKNIWELSQLSSLISLLQLTKSLNSHHILAPFVR